MASFVLVHGAWHGAWCWGALEAELGARGHEVVAVDLPCDDPSATFTTYAAVVERAVAEAGEDVVLVGHSLAGHTIPLVAAARPVRHLVFVCAVLPEPGRSFAEQIERDPAMLSAGRTRGTEVDEHGRRRWVDLDAAREVMYADCADDAVRSAFEQLRPQAAAPYLEPCPLTAFPDVARTYVLGAEDRLVNPDWSRGAAVERLGVEPVELPGSHSPFLARPGALADVLVACAG